MCIRDSDIDALRVAALEARSTIGIHHWQEVQGGLRLQAFYQRIVWVFAEEAEQVHQ